MSSVCTLKCDICGKLRMDDANRWLENSTNEGVVSVAKLGTFRSIEVHLCGQKCAMKWIGGKIGELHKSA